METNLNRCGIKIHIVQGFSLGQTPSENQYTLRRNYYPSTFQIDWKYLFIAPRSGLDSGRSLGNLDETRIHHEVQNSSSFATSLSPLA